ncbi:hypothetical protein Y1Q_0002166 [Alligator mississippiensis]|uniref:Uncharacterized protein n=1 Tax=Alligator mississippiensis TaxID=8496 RepID=A0A151MPS8_ALLMI|nr:hypothetical protein Y1Q_0002166 [Alligator mississippiensis]
MLLGRYRTSIYDTLEKVQDAEAEWRKMCNRKGWLGEFEESEASVDETDEIDLHGVASSLQFQEAQEKDHKIQRLRTQALGTTTSQAPASDGILQFKKWNKPEEWAAFMEADMEDFGPQGTVQERGTARTEAQVQIGEQLSTSQRYKMHYTH